MTDLAKLRELAIAARPFWESAARTAATAAYYAAANPTTMLCLLDRLERAEDSLRTCRKYLRDPYKAPESVPELIAEEIDAYFDSLEPEATP